MSNFCIVILAAGEGKRMKTSLPKVLHELCGKPMVAHVVEAAKKVSAKKLVVVVGRRWPQVKDVLGKGVLVAVQREPRGTADAIKAAKDKIPSSAKDVIVLYGDTPLITEATIRALYQSHIEKNASCTVLTTFLENPKGYGRILRNESGKLIGIIEDKDATTHQKAIKEINTGMYCFRRLGLAEALEHVRPLNQSNEFYLTDVFAWMSQRGKKIDACVADDSREVLGVNSQMQLHEAQEILRQRQLESRIENGVQIEDMRSTFIDQTATIDAGTQILPFSYIEKNVVIGRNCSVGPFCHLREGTVLKDGVSVGNFAEVKNSVLGQGSVMHHLGYVGDAVVGKNVNIGAGTVVANYDGKKKNKTVIKDRAFIGSDAVLIAPVVIGKGAVVGAGSVVTKNHHVPDRGIVVGVPARELKPSKKRG
ncbi:MAG: NTP transferase domain-containing protein [Candidatus Omnitrophota bacterium]